MRILTAMVTLALAASASAAEVSKAAGYVDVGVSAGVLKMSTAHQLGDPLLFPPSLQTPLPAFGLGPIFEGRLGIYANRWIGLEADAGYALLSVAGGGSAAVIPLSARLILAYPLGDMDVFGAVGGTFQGVMSPQSVLGNDWDGAVNVGGGLKYHLSDEWGLRFEFRDTIGTRFSGRFGANNIEGTVGVAYTFGPLMKPPPPPPDSDKDGVPDQFDKCPDRPSFAPDGCPLDSDGDGIVDAKDECPTVAAQTPNGCPAPDSDKDGVPDSKDECADVAGDMDNGCLKDTDQDGVPDKNDKCADVAAKTDDGCPAPDKDSDGVPDASDQCIDIAGDMDNGCLRDTDGDGNPDKTDACKEVASKAPDGCPFGDSDKDGLTDDNDKCKDVPETANMYLDDDGCADEIPKALKTLTGATKDIAFAKGAPAVAKTSDKALAAIAKYMAKDDPNSIISITSHVDTDPKGKITADAARELTMKRVESVRDLLVKKGVAGDRIEIAGKGFDEPAPLPPEPPVDPKSKKKAKPAPKPANERFEIRWKTKG